MEYSTRVFPEYWNKIYKYIQICIQIYTNIQIEYVYVYEISLLVLNLAMFVSK